MVNSMVKRRYLWILAGALLVITPAAARTFPITPATPPAQFWYVGVVFYLALAAVNTLGLMRIKQVPPVSAAWRVVGGMCLMLVLLWLVVTCSDSCMAMDVRMGAGGRLLPLLPPFSSDLVSDFYFANITALLLMMGCVLTGWWLVGMPRHIRDTRPRLRGFAGVLTAGATLGILVLIFFASSFPGSLAFLVLGILIYATIVNWRIGVLVVVNVGVWALFTFPFALGGAYQQVTGGFARECLQEQVDLAYGLVAYTRTHGGRLPEQWFLQYAMDDTFTPLKPSLPKRKAPPFSPECPLTKSLHGLPGDYGWNHALAGRTLKEVEALTPPQPVITCPIHNGKDGIRTRLEVTTDQLAYLEQAPGEKKIPVPREWEEWGIE
jgi:hypothetical protein